MKSVAIIYDCMLRSRLCKYRLDHCSEYALGIYNLNLIVTHCSGLTGLENKNGLSCGETSRCEESAYNFTLFVGTSTTDWVCSSDSKLINMFDPYLQLK